MKIQIDYEDITASWNHLNRLYETYANASNSKKDGSFPWLLTADTNLPNQVVIEFRQNGLYVRKVCKAKVLESGTLAINSPLLLGLPNTKDITIEFDPDAPSELVKQASNQQKIRRCKFATKRTKGKMDVLQDQTLDVDILYDISPTHTFNTKMLRDAYNIIAFMPRYELKVASTINTYLTVRMVIKDGNKLAMYSNDRFCAAIYKTVLPVNFPDVDMTMRRDFFELLVSTSMGDQFQIGFGDKGFIVEGPDLKIIHPQMIHDEIDLDAAVGSFKDEVANASLKCNAKVVLESFAESLNLTNVLTGNELDGRVEITLQDNVRTPNVNVTTSFGESKSDFEVQDIAVPKTGCVVAVSGKLMGQFLKLLNEQNIDMFIWDNAIMMQNLTATSDTIYTMSTLT